MVQTGRSGGDFTPPEAIITPDPDFRANRRGFKVTALISAPNGPLKGDIRVPGDKSISHRALMIGAVAIGETVINGLLKGNDVLRTAAALRTMGIEVIAGADGSWRVHGTGVGGLAAPAGVLDMGNSGTGARLLLGLLATHPFTTHLTGDASLCVRPMERVAAPIRRMGAQVLTQPGGRMPLAVIGTQEAVPITYELPVASAQVKSAILLAGLNIPGRTTVIEPRPSRDHTELMLRHFGADLTVDEVAGGGRSIALTGEPELQAREISVPGDPSSAAFPGVAALIVPGSELTIRGVGINPLRAGLFDTLREMGADISYGNQADVAGEPVADITFRAGELTGIEVPAERAPAMIDEYPILAAAAAVARGRTRMLGLGELRVKESDRLSAIAAGLSSAGIDVAEGEDSLTIEGCAGAPPGGATVAARADHRIAMAFLTLGLAAREPVTIDDGSNIATSFPGFTDLMNNLGATITPATFANEPA